MNEIQPSMTNQQKKHRELQTVIYLSELFFTTPKEDYNYLLVDVKPGQPTRFTLNRFRPWSQVLT
jgi:hypothetical protein